jgi:hypothetical protein
MNRDFDLILDECLERLNNGDTIEECLKLHPEFVSELEPLLRTAKELQCQTVFVPSAEAKAKGRACLHQEMDGITPNQNRLGPSFIRRLLAQPKRWAPVAVALVLAVIIFSVWPMFNNGKLQAFEGTVQNADSVSGMLTVKLTNGTTTTFNYTDVSVGTTRNTLGSATFETGDRVTIKQDKHGHVEKLQVGNADIDGTIKSLDTNSLTISTQRNRDITLQLTPETQTKIGYEGTAVFSDLKAGQTIDAKYNVTSMKALKLDVAAGNGAAGGEAHGTIKAVDTANTALTVVTENGREITLHVMPDTMIRIEDQGQAALSGVHIGQNTEVTYDPGNMNALKLSIHANPRNQKGNQNLQDGQNHEDKNGEKQTGGQKYQYSKDHQGRD